MIKWVPANSEEEKESGIRFLCRHAENLGVPYKWSTVMSALACSLNEGGFMIGLDGIGQVRGALAYTHGTGEGDYEDLSRIEVHLLYIEESVRYGGALIEAVQALSLRVIGLPGKIEEIGFYGMPTVGNRRLFGKIATLSNTKMHPCGLLDFYVATPENLRQYADRLDSRRKALSE